MVADLIYPLDPIVRAKYEDQLQRNKLSIEHMRNDMLNVNDQNIFALQSVNINLQAILKADDKARSMEPFEQIEVDAHAYPLDGDTRTRLETMYRSNLSILDQMRHAYYRPTGDDAVRREEAVKRQNAQIIAVLKRDQLHKLEEVA